MHVTRRWLLPIVMVGVAVLGMTSPALAAHPDQVDSASQPVTRRHSNLPTELWQAILDDMSPDVEDISPDLRAFMRLRQVSTIHRKQVDVYLAAHPRLWRLLRTATLERLLAEPTVPQEWKRVVSETVLTPELTPDIARSPGDKSSIHRTRVVQDQRELDIALADPTQRTINIIGDGAMNIGKATEGHILRLHDTAQVTDMNAGSVFAYDSSQVYKVAGGHVVACGQVHLHDIAVTGSVDALDEVQIHGVSSGRVITLGKVQVHGVTGGKVHLLEYAQAHIPTGGTIYSMNPGINVITPGVGVTIIHTF